MKVVRATASMMTEPVTSQIRSDHTLKKVQGIILFPKVIPGRPLNDITIKSTDARAEISKRWRHSQKKARHIF